MSMVTAEHSLPIAIEGVVLTLGSITLLGF